MLRATTDFLCCLGSFWGMSRLLVSYVLSIHKLQWTELNEFVKVKFELQLRLQAMLFSIYTAQKI